MGNALANSILDQAKQTVADGKYDEAFGLLELIPEVDHSRPTVLQIRTACEGALLASLRLRFSDLEVYPQRNLQLANFKAYRLDAHDGYVWDLFDGGTSLDDAIAISPRSELQTLRSVARLVDLDLLMINNRS